MTKIIMVKMLVILSPQPKLNKTKWFHIKTCNLISENGSIIKPSVVLFTMETQVH